jgi:hypothetical protein
MFSIIIIVICSIINSAQAAERVKVRLFNQAELAQAKRYSSDEFLLQRKRRELSERSRAFFAYVLKQGQKAAIASNDDELGQGALKVLELYAPPLNLDYLIKKEFLKDVKKYE